MSKVVPGRFSAQIDESFVVFLIGMRVNNIWAVNKWLPTAQAMGPMLNVLHQYSEKGFLGQESFFRLFPITTVMITYWKSFEHLEYFARNADDPHLKPWREFNRSIGNDGSVGIWHETYLIPAGQSESIYANMPVFGLAAATTHIPAVGKKETARRRLGGNNTPAVPS
ncbi:DUF4188 domain-containing protein [Chamaesiphon polymorphus]|uniref:DUF4188 domain-containing protein n=1 Tax=Chamaesiphon polymorphus CCALA 037 TaxID=2107692 RepID=A0A2T1GDC7_9CYAN|nr:DUF4188 domain-containing protein [Chamaesiphon polymorphus]PSB55369.1 DUF4188 domain-containing protein [Chamaesiphon polymorphus CCALA 037]